MSTRYLYVLAAYKDVVRSADLGELPRGAPYRWRGEVHRVLVSHQFIRSSHAFPIQQQTFHGSPPGCPVLGFAPPCV